MSRPGRRVPLSIAIAALVALAVPAAAQAVTYTVGAGGGACGDPDLTCETLVAAAAAVGNGDTVNVNPGQYAGATFNNVGLTIDGTGPGVVVTGTLQFGTTGAGTLADMTIVQSGAAPAVGSEGPGLFIRDIVAVGGTHGVLLTSGNNTIIRSYIVTRNSDGISDAVRVHSGDAGNKSLLIQSTLLVGGFAGIGGFAEDSLVAGDITIEAHHVTAAGSTRGISARASQISLGTGSVAATFEDSISLSNNADPGLLATASVTPVGSNITTAPQPSVIFADPLNKNFRLKPGSPAIDAGGYNAPESTEDFEGDARPGPITDLGADEYVNSAPKAVIAVTTQIPRDGQPVQFDGGGSKDQPGGSIASYHWDFGDGKTQTTTTPTVAHTYTGEGTRTAKLAVKDGEGVFSSVASTSVKVVDGGAPSVVITTPKSKQKIFQFVRKTKTVTKNGKKVKVKVKTKTRTRLKFKGSASDKSGVARIYMIVEKTASSSTQTVAQGRQSTPAKRCRFLDSKLGLRRVRCTQPIFIIVKVASNSTSWAYNVRKSIKLSKGKYKASMYGLDKAANFGNAAPKADRNITFTIR